MLLLLVSLVFHGLRALRLLRQTQFILLLLYYLFSTVCCIGIRAKRSSERCTRRVTMWLDGGTSYLPTSHLTNTPTKYPNYQSSPSRNIITNYTNTLSMRGFRRKARHRPEGARAKRRATKRRNVEEEEPTDDDDEALRNDLPERYTTKWGTSYCMCMYSLLTNPLNLPRTELGGTTRRGVLP